MTYRDGTDAHQFEEALNVLIKHLKTVMLEETKSGDFDALNDNLATLTSLEACREHALTPDAPLHLAAQDGYRIFNSRMEGQL